MGSWVGIMDVFMIRFASYRAWVYHRWALFNVLHYRIITFSFYCASYMRCLRPSFKIWIFVIFKSQICAIFCKNFIWKKHIVITFLCFRCYLEFYIQRAQYLKKAFHSLMFFFLWPSLSRRLIIAFSLGYQQPQHCWEQDWQRNFTVCERWRPLEHRRSHGKRYNHFAAWIGTAACVE